MIMKAQVYKCEVCGNIVTVLHAGDGTLVCCDQPMTLLAENSVDASQEKHVPVVEKIAGGVIVHVGSVEHPMTPEHHIEWIEVQTYDKVYRKSLVPGEKPVATFLLTEEVVYARAFCNLHLLWKS
jgi:superoxide reductase